MNNPNKPTSTPRGVLVTTRILWGAMLLGEVIFLCVAMAFQQGRGGDLKLGGILGFVAVLLVISATPIAYLLRGQMYGTARLTNDVEPQRYLTANIVFLALLEGPAFLGIVAFMVSGQAWPALLATGIAMLVQAVNFPTGSAMGVDRI